MKKIVLLLAVAILACVPAEAKPRHFYTDKKFWISEAVIGTAIFLDYHSTATHPYGPETSPLLGQWPSNGRIAGIGVLDFGFESGLNIAFYKVVRMGPETKTWDVLGYVSEPTVSLATHLPAAIHNYRLQPPAPGSDSGILAQ